MKQWKEIGFSVHYGEIYFFFRDTTETQGRRLSFKLPAAIATISDEPSVKYHTVPDQHLSRFVKRQKIQSNLVLHFHEQ